MTTLAARQLRRGDTRDHDCALTSHRLSIAHGILADQGVTWHTEHGNTVINLGAYGSHACADNCHTNIVQPWVTDEILDAAYRLADLIQTARGGHYRSQAFAAKAAAERKART